MHIIAIRSGMSSIGYSSAFYIAAVAMIVLFAFLISGAWLLMIGIYEDRTK
jgi:hypothetical protein